MLVFDLSTIFLYSIYSKNLSITKTTYISYIIRLQTRFGPLVIIYTIYIYLICKITRCDFARYRILLPYEDLNYIDMYISFVRYPTHMLKNVVRL